MVRSIASRQIGVIADTHGLFDPALVEHFAGVTAILHAGDIGDSDVIRQLRRIAPVIAVSGNVDDFERSGFPRERVVRRDGVTIAIRHILFERGHLMGEAREWFTVIHLAPGTPTDMQTTLNPKASLETQKRLRELYGLDKPLHVQYWDWLKRLAVLDFGLSFPPDRRPVWDKIRERIGVTVGLNLMAMLLVLTVAIPIGVIAASRPHSWFDRGTTLFVFFGFAMPTFWLALLLIMFFGVYLDWLPVSGLTSLNFRQFTFWQKVQDLAAHVMLPVLVSAFGGLAGMSRYMRGNMLEVDRYGRH